MSAAASRNRSTGQKRKLNVGKSSLSVKRKNIPESDGKEVAQEENGDEEDACVICMEDKVGRLGALNCCSHTFCANCILKWSETSNTCPICVRRFNKVTEFESGSSKQSGTKKRKLKTHKIKKQVQGNAPSHLPAGDLMGNFARYRSFPGLQFLSGFFDRDFGRLGHPADIALLAAHISPGRRADPFSDTGFRTVRRLPAQQRPVPRRATSTTNVRRLPSSDTSARMSAPLLSSSGPTVTLLQGSRQARFRGDSTRTSSSSMRTRQTSSSDRTPREGMTLENPVDLCGLENDEDVCDILDEVDVSSDDVLFGIDGGEDDDSIELTNGWDEGVSGAIELADVEEQGGGTIEEVIRLSSAPLVVDVEQEMDELLDDSENEVVDLLDVD